MSSPAVQVRSRVPRLASSLGAAAVQQARLRVVPHGRSRAPRVPFVTLVSLLLVGGVVGLLLFNTSMQQASFAASALEQQATTLAARQQTLRMELDDLRNPQRVATEAQRMGMVIPSTPTFLTLDGEVSGARVPATPADRLQIEPPPVRKPAVLAPAPTIVTVRADAAGDRRDRTDAARKERRAERRNNRG